jgi:hypothetical protein
MGRLHHLKETLPRNLSDNADYDDVEFVILDYNSPDGILTWMNQAMADPMASGKVVYWREASARRWNMPHAKNVAHLLATGDVVCNLDADNLTGAGYAAKIADEFSSRERALVVHPMGGGSGGRVAVRRRDFIALRGYDETLSHGWGREDDDLKQRARIAGLTQTAVAQPGDGAIEHSDAERIKFMPQWKDVRSAHDSQASTLLRRPPGAIINPQGYGRAVVRRGASGEPVSVLEPLDGDSVFSVFESTEGWFGTDEGELLLASAERALGLGQKTIVELGSFAGRTTALLGWAAHVLGGRVYAVDPHEGEVSDPSKGRAQMPPTLAKFHSTVTRARIGPFVELIRKRSVEVKWSQSISMLFLDALHDYDNVAADYAHFAPWVLKGGIIAFHDHHPIWPGVMRLVSEKVGSGSIRVTGTANSLLVAEKLTALGTS